MADLVFDNTLLTITALLTVIASLVSLWKAYRVETVETDYALLRKWRLLQPGLRLLLVFLLVTLVFGILSVIRYWEEIRRFEGSLFYGTGLFLTMVAGMFVRVLATNHESGSPMFNVSASDLMYPLLFSLLVFYPIWALAADGRGGLFPFYSAFLNGYFWESVVSAARRSQQEPARS